MKIIEYEKLLVIESILDRQDQVRSKSRSAQMSRLILVRT